MKALVAAAVIAALSFPAMAYNNDLDICGFQVPPKALQKEPNVPYIVRYVPNASPKCNVEAAACAGRYAPDKWVIWISTQHMGYKLTQYELDCLLTHEKAHLPPNNWKASHMGHWDKPVKWYPDGINPDAP